MRRDDIGFHLLMEEVGVAGILEDTDLDRQGRINRIREVLKQRRWPALRQAEKRYEKTLRSLDLDKGMQLMVPRFLRGRQYLLTLRFQTPDELRHFVTGADPLPAIPLFRQLLNREKM